MSKLQRTVRFSINPGEPYDTASGPSLNGFASHPSPRGWNRFYELRVTCSGIPDADTGYLVNIKAIDRAVRSRAIPLIAETVETAPQSDPAALLPELLVAIASELDVRVHALALRLTPVTELEIAAPERPGTESSMPQTVIHRQRFDFAAAHRLHVPNLSDDENRALFGKCNNPSGHGHNYQIEPVVSSPITENGSTVTLEQIERVTDATIIEPFDHTNLNVDTEPFGPAGVNPSVENMAKVFFELLAPAIAELGGTLRELTVWETDRTSCTYAGNAT